MKPKPAPPPAPVYAFLYVFLLAACLALAARYALAFLAITPEFPQAGDFFGYLQSAQDIRTGAAPHNLPPFTFDSPHARLLLTFFQQQKIPLDDYTELLAPNAYHYHEISNLIANQYPPGIPLLLAAFPEGRALHFAAYITIALLLALPLAVYLKTLARWNHNLAPAAFTTLAALAGLYMFGISVSYAIDLFCLPLILLLTCIHFARRNESRSAKLLALLAGALFGYGILSRIATILFLPGLLLLLCPKKLSPALAIKPALFLLGTLLCGILPILHYQYKLTGSTFTSTYIHLDIASATLSTLLPNATFYTIGSGNLLLFTLLLAAAAFYILHARRPASRDLFAVPLLFAIPTIYFLLHPVTTDYYQLPTILTCLFTMAFATLSIPPQPQTPRTLIPPLFIALVIAAHVLTLPPLPTAAQMRPPSIELPPALKNPNAWIFADRFSGTLWYYHATPCSALVHASPQARQKAFQFIAERNDPIYILYDNPAVEPVLSELKHQGATLEQVASFGNRPVLQLHWQMPGSMP